MATNDTGDADRRASEQALLVNRAKAIQEYAQVEQSLCMLLAYLLKTPNELAGIIFFRIVNTRSRSAIFEGLLKRRVSNEFKPYWSSMLKLIGGLDQQRNEIVHWFTAVNDAPPAKPEYRLIPPNFWAMNDSTPYYTVNGLIDFIARCDYCSRSLNMFNIVIFQDHQFEKRDTWLDIFREEAVYPPPNTHPLYRTYSEHYNPPQSFQE